MEALKQLEGLHRQRLQHDPSDLVARISLAWCLFMQALHQSGRESLIAAVLDTAPGSDEQLVRRLRAALGMEADTLLRECLRQTLTVQQLSASPRAQSDARKLQDLVRLFGSEQVVTEAEQEAASILAQVTGELLRDPRYSGGRGARSRHPSDRG